MAGGARRQHLPPCAATLPALLRDQPPNDKVFRLIDGEWRRGPVLGA